MDDPYHIGFVADKTPDVRELYTQCRQAGLKTTYDGQTETVAEYSIGLTAHTDSRLEDALNALEQTDSGSMRFWTESDMILRVGISPPTTKDEPMLGCVNIGFQTSEIDGDAHSDSIYRARINELLNLIETIVPLVNPSYVWSSVYKGHEGYKRFVPDGEPIAETIEDLSWVTVVSPQVADQFGGREHVLDTPAWRVRELNSGHIMLVLQEHPYDAMKPTHSSSEAHLFD
ncbi:hypothetical protein [Haloarcula sp. CBA1127]|uniref:hypothetical protein n=1 Tax=Haloarcula sp. CBA1127 TaxID=1765055 RepID=UPI00073F923A|nr:hypothetical protein [Haloarcula sp. CBA1127]